MAGLPNRVNPISLKCYLSRKPDNGSERKERKANPYRHYPKLLTGAGKAYTYQKYRKPKQTKKIWTT